MEEEEDVGFLGRCLVSASWGAKPHFCHSTDEKREGWEGKWLIQGHTAGQRQRGNSDCLSGSKVCSGPPHKGKARGHADDGAAPPLPPPPGAAASSLLCVPGLGGDTRSQGQPGLERPSSVPAELRK